MQNDSELRNYFDGAFNSSFIPQASGICYFVIQLNEKEYH